jgi:hypothetical protein
VTPANRERAAWLKTGRFISVDPGTDHPAVAIWNRGQLVHANRVKIPTKKWRELESGERVRLIVNACHDYALPHLAGEAPLAVVGEWPKAYKIGQSKNSADQLFPLAAITAGVAVRFGVQSITPIPFEWIGTIPKDEDNPDPWASPRGALVKRRLGVLELSAVVPSHDAVDAAGIGLWVLARLERVYVGSV